MVEFFKGLSFFILPLGLGCKRHEFFEKQIRKLGGTVAKNNGKASHVLIEDSVSENCASALKKEGFDGRKDFKYLRVSWVSECLKRGELVDADPFEVGWMKSEERTNREADEDEDSPKRLKLESEKFICSMPSSSSQHETSEMKHIIVNELKKLANAYALRHDTWRSHGYRKAISAVLLYEKDISSFEEAQSIPGIGEKMALKIMEIIESGKLKKVDEIFDEKTKVMDVFCKVYGVGPSTAEGWYIQGFRTLEDLKTKVKLTKQQQIGLKLYGDLLERIPRTEVVQIADVVKEEARKVDASLSVELVGSFRRGKPTCGDVDLMIVNGGLKTPSEILLLLTEPLKAKGYLTDDLVSLEDSENFDQQNNHRKYLGVFKLLGENQTHRRIDFFVVPKSEYASALMHYTGSALFNRYIRLLAAKKEMTLTEHGLFTGIIRKSSEVMNKGQLVPTPTEEDIFRHLGLPYRTPAERDH